MFSALIGSISFSGSMVAFAKLQELLPGRPLVFPGQNVVNALLFAATVGAAVRRRRSTEDQRLARALARRRAPLRRHARAADRRRGHAGRHLVPELLHRAGRRRDRLRARQQRADHRRHARRRLGNAAHGPHGPGDEPLARERALRRVRRGAGQAAAAAARAEDGKLVREVDGRRRGGHARVRRQVDGRPRLRAGGRAGPARRAGAGRPAREARRRGRSTRSIRSRAACRAT